MLPPVRAALSSTADYQGQAQPAVNPARIAVSSNALQSQQGADTSLSGARLDAASLSAQLKLAQGSSIFAETIGKLLKTPRRENETLIDYTARLFEAVQALKPQEVANVERLLNQIVKGISLRLMAEILKEPTGPAAARLAAHIETANIAQRDLATKTVVSFYRQNGSADVPLNANTPRMQKGGSPTAATPANQTDPTATASHDEETAPLRQQPLNEGARKAADGGQSQRPTAAPTSSTSTAPSATPDQPNQVSKPAGGAPSVIDTAPSQGTSTRPSVAPDVLSGAIRQAPPGAAPAAPLPGAALPANSAVIPGTPTAVIVNQAQIATGQAAEQTSTAEPEEMQALARTAVEMFKLDVPVPARLWSALSDQTLLKLANWLATVLSELDLPETANLPTSSAAAQTTADDKPVDQQRTASSPNSAAAPQTSSPATPPPVKDTASDGQRLAAAVVRADPPEQNMAAMAGAAGALPFQAREAPPWPHVAAYPPADEEPRHRERQAEPIEAIEDEEQDEASQQQAFGDEHEPEGEEPQDDDVEGEEIARDTMTRAEKAAGYRAGEARLEADAPEARPSDFYWRMAGWT